MKPSDVEKPSMAFPLVLPDLCFFMRIGTHDGGNIFTGFLDRMCWKYLATQISTEVSRKSVK